GGVLGGALGGLLGGLARGLLSLPLAIPGLEDLALGLQSLDVVARLGQLGLGVGLVALDLLALTLLLLGLGLGVGDGLLSHPLLDRSVRLGLLGLTRGGARGRVPVGLLGAGALQALHRRVMGVGDDLEQSAAGEQVLGVVGTDEGGERTDRAALLVAGGDEQ